MTFLLLRLIDRAAIASVRVRRHAQWVVDVTACWRAGAPPGPPPSQANREGMNRMPKSLEEIREELKMLGERMDGDLQHDRAITWLWSIVDMLVAYLQHEEEGEK